MFIKCLQDSNWLGEQLKAIEQGVGGMLPAIGVTIATGGAGAPAAVAQMASLATTGVQAAGQGTQEAYRDGAGDVGGAAYGAVTGAAEAGVEKLTGGASKWLFGAGVFDDILPILPRNIVTRMMGTFAGEGLEEAITEAANPLMKTTYQGADALTAYTDPEERRELIGDTVTSFLQGGATAVVFAGTVGYGVSHPGGGFGARENNVNELIEDIEGLKRKEGNLRRAYKLTPEKDAEIAGQVQARYEDIQRNLQAVDSERRKKMIETFALDKSFDKDGNFTEDFRRRLGIDSEGEGTDTGSSDIEGDVRHSLKYTTDNRPVAVVNDDITRYAKDDRELVSLAKERITHFKRVPIHGQSIHFLKDTKGEYTYSKYTQHLRKNNPDVYKDKMRLAAHPQDIVYATTDYVNEGLKHSRTDDIVDFARGEILMDIAGRKYTGEVVIGFTKSGVCELHDIVNIVPTVFEYKKEAPRKSIGADNGTLGRKGEASSKHSIAQNEASVKPSAKKLHPEFFKHTMILRRLCGTMTATQNEDF